MFKTFDKTDWYGMAGATSFEGNSGERLEPLVSYDLTVDGREACAVIDAEGLVIQVLPTETRVEEIWTPATPALGMRFLALLGDTTELTTEALGNRGFMVEAQY